MIAGRLKMDIIVRNEQPKDFARTEQLAREAFWNVYIPGAYEHYIVHTMREHPDYIKELAFVIEVDGDVKGAVYYTRAQITGAENSWPVIAMGPVFIAPDFQHRGLGKRLIAHSIEQAAKEGFKAIMLLGYPQEYASYGFCGGKKYGVCMPDGNFYKCLQLLPLTENALAGCQGKAIFSAALEPDIAAAEEYDKNFAYREKLVLPSQKKFSEACVALDE